MTLGMRLQLDENVLKCGKAAYESGKRFGKESLIELKWLTKKYSAGFVYT